jgi:hypothetical protein
VDATFINAQPEARYHKRLVLPILPIRIVGLLLVLFVDCLYVLGDGVLAYK